MNRIKIAIFGLLIFFWTLTIGTVSAVDITLDDKGDLDISCVFDTVTETYTCTADNIHVTGAVLLQSGENVELVAQNDFVVDIGATLTSNAGSGQVGGNLAVDSNNAEIHGSLISSGGGCSGSHGCVKGGGGDIDIEANDVLISGEVSSSGNDGSCNSYPCIIKAGGAGNVNIHAAAIEISPVGKVLADGGKTQGCQMYPGDGGLVALTANSATIAGKVSVDGGESRGIVIWCGGPTPSSGGTIDIVADDLHIVTGELSLRSGDVTNAASGNARAGPGGVLEIDAKNTVITGAVINAFGGDASSPINWYWDPTRDNGGPGGNVTIRSDRLIVGTNSINVYGGAAYGRREGTFRYLPGGYEYGGDGGRIEIETFSSLAPLGTYYAYGGKAYTRDGTAVDGDDGTIVIKACDFDGSAAEFNPLAAFVPNNCVVEATIDINPDTLNLKSRGRWVTAYIELPEGYDVADIDVSTVLLGDTIPAELHPSHIRDHDSDGIPDLMVKFDRAEVIDLVKALNLDPPAEVELTVTGSLIDGTLLEGSDTIRVIKRGEHMSRKRGR